MALKDIPVVVEKITRATFLYMDPRKPEEKMAQCETCVHFINDKGLCRQFGPDDKIGPNYSCGLYSPGQNATGKTPQSLVTPEEAGLVERQVRCENCVFFDPDNEPRKHCDLYTQLNLIMPGVFELDRFVQPQGCCNAQTPGKRNPAVFGPFGPIKHQETAGSMDAAAGSPKAAGVLLTSGDRALFLKRSDKSRDHAGEWCCPAGGIEAGETPEQAARREFAEETGLPGLLTGDFTQIDEGNGFLTFRQKVQDEPAPTLNDEHSEYVWAPMDAPPKPLHPGLASTLNKLRQARAAQDSARIYDTNGWFEVKDTPLTGVGVYQYAESSVKEGGDPRKIVNVFRPEEELNNSETMNSMRLLPWTDSHPSDLLGPEDKGLVPAEEKGVHGVTGEQISFRDKLLRGNIKVFSETLARKIAAGKRQLSIGYHCRFVHQPGVYEGTPYEYVQRDIRGNHLASEQFGKMADVSSVRDRAEHKFAFALDMKESGATSDVAGIAAAEKGTGQHHPNGAHDMPDMTDEEKAKAKKAAEDRRAARDSARSARDSRRGMDSMTSEEEAGYDEKECAEDAEEENDDKDDDSKEAKDRKSARDRRAGARDARKSARDRMAKRGGMDAAAVAKIVDERVAATVGTGMDARVNAAVETRVNAEVEKRVKEIGPTLRREENAKNALYGRLSPHVGVFDHAEMTLAAMSQYGLEKLGVTAKPADPVSALDFLLQGRAQAQPAGGFAQDASAQTGSTADFLRSIQ